MIIAISKNPIVQLEVKFLNAYEKWTQKYWNKKPHHVTCQICGDTLSSDKEKHSPEQCGWRHLKDTSGIEKGNWGWICHSCDCHFESNFIKLDDLSLCEIRDLKAAGKIPDYVHREKDWDNDCGKFVDTWGWRYNDEQ